LSWLEGQPEST